MLRFFSPPRLVGILLLALPLWVSAQTFNRAYGGAQDDHATCVVQTQTGDFIAAGFTHSFGSGKSDIWVLCTDAYGNQRWQISLGGADHEWPHDLIETRDGGLLLAGWHLDPRMGRARNAWLVKLTATGEVMWERSYGGQRGDVATALAELPNGDIALAGFSQSFSRGKKDIWLLRLDAEGFQKWSRNYGAGGEEEARDVAVLPDGSVVLTGYTGSYGNGASDLLVMRVDSSGRGIWRRNYGGETNDLGEAIAYGADGRLYIAGWTASEGAGGLDGTLLCLNDKGIYQWQRTYGTANRDVFYDLTVGNDEVVAIGTSNFGAGPALWLLRTDLMGNLRHEERLRGQEDDFGHAIASTRDGGLVLAGGTRSFALADNQSDFWLIKLNSLSNASLSSPVVDATQAAATGWDPFATDAASEPRRPTAYPSETNASFKPNLYVLAVGVSRYANSSVNLEYAHVDAQTFAERMQKMEGQLYNQVVVRRVLNEDATLVNIKSGISWLEREATQHDVVVLFVSSHGALDNKRNLYVLPHDFDAQNLFATGLNIRDLTEGMNGVTCKKLVLLDACHSGQSGRDLLSFGDANARATGANLNELVQELIDAEPGLTVMTSSSGREFSYETSRWGHGAFTMALLEGLDGRADYNADRVIHLNELDLWVSQRVKELTNGLQHPFTPINLFGNIPVWVY